jgi:hypothetical protein
MTLRPAAIAAGRSLRANAGLGGAHSSIPAPSKPARGASWCWKYAVASDALSLEVNLDVGPNAQCSAAMPVPLRTAAASAAFEDVSSRFVPGREP